MGGSGAFADQLTRLDLLVLDELGYRPFTEPERPTAVPSDQPPSRADLDRTNLTFAEWPTVFGDANGIEFARLGWRGTQHEARSRHGAVMALARILVLPACPTCPGKRWGRHASAEGPA